MILYINNKDKQLVEVKLISVKGEALSAKSEANQFGSQVLLPLIVKLLKENNLEFKDLTGIETEIGPRSFTGLRVGASVAQALGFSLNIPVNGKLNTPVDLKYS